MSGKRQKPRRAGGLDARSDLYIVNGVCGRCTKRWLMLIGTPDGRLVDVQYRRQSLPDDSPLVAASTIPTLLPRGQWYDPWTNRVGPIAPRVRVKDAAGAPLSPEDFERMLSDPDYTPPAGPKRYVVTCDPGRCRIQKPLTWATLAEAYHQAAAERHAEVAL